MSRRLHFSLPLLSKELLDLAGRSRTYLLRMAYAAILMFISFLALKNSIPPGARAASDYLGCGPAVMLALGYAQQIGLQLVLPAITCGAFTVEKERNTLGLLFLTKLGPWTILLEKFLSRLLVAWSFVVISGPVIAFCYGLGGITLDDLLAQILSLLVSSFTIVSFSILCSTWFRTSTTALVASYALIFGSRLLLQMVIYSALLTSSAIPATNTLRSVVLLGGISIDDLPYASWGFSPLYTTVLLCAVWVLISILSLRFARSLLVSRAFVPPDNALRLVWKWLDGMFERANRNPITRGIVIIRPTNRLPGDDPIAWRETTTRALGQTSHVIRLLILVEAPIILVMSLRGMMSMDMEGRLVIPAVQAVSWIALVLVTCVLSAGLIAGERARQTLDPLLVTPLLSHEIVRQKMAGVTRMIWICSVPIWTCLLIRLSQGAIFYFLIQASMLLIYPRTVAWIAMGHGLRSKTAMAAVLKSLLEISLICLLPLLLLAPEFLSLLRVSMHTRQFLSLLSFSSPLTMLLASEVGARPGMGEPRMLAMLVFNPPVALLLNTVFHNWLLKVKSAACLQQADVLLGRSRKPCPETRLSAVEEYLRTPEAKRNAAIEL